jgi:hypothetical protein
MGRAKTLSSDEALSFVGHPSLQRGGDEIVKAFLHEPTNGTSPVMADRRRRALSVGAWRFTLLQQSLQDMSPFGFAPKVKVYQDEVAPFSGVAGGAEDLL